MGDPTQAKDNHRTHRKAAPAAAREKQKSSASKEGMQDDTTMSSINDTNIKSEGNHTALLNTPSVSSKSAPSRDDNTESPDWCEVFKDAIELESLIFCVHRTTARDTLFKLVKNLKILSGKLKRHEEVKLHLRGSTITRNNSTLQKRSLENGAEEGSKAKKPRAIPLESMQELAMPKSSSLTIPPTLKIKDQWVQHHQHGSSLHCPDFESTNSCPLGSNCNLLHIFTPRKANPIIEKEKRRITLQYSKHDLQKVYENYRNMSISKTDFSEKIKNDEFNVPNYCCAITCPIDHTIYYAQPFPGDVATKANRSTQGIWFYKSMKEAKVAAVTHLICDLVDRNIVPKDFMPRGQPDVGVCQKLGVNKGTQLTKGSTISRSDSSIKERNTAPPNLPDITPLNFMESNYQERCATFNTSSGCRFACRCSYAHVHYPSDLNGSDFPTKEALILAYNQNFQMDLEDSFFQNSSRPFTSSPFRVMSAIDDNGNLWYTAALKCPREGTIYYAAGGKTGQWNKQNIFLYPCVEDAKLAVAGIVLDSFKKRGMFGDRNVGIMSLSCNGLSSSLQPSNSSAPSQQSPYQQQPQMMHYMQQMQPQFNVHQHQGSVGGTVQHRANGQGSYGLGCQPYQSRPSFVSTPPAVPPPPSRAATESFIPPPPPPRSQSFGR